MSNQHHIEKILRNIPGFDINLRKINFERLGAGRTNVSYLVQDGIRKYVLRLNSEKSKHYNIDRSRELKILNVLKDREIGPKVVYCDPSYNFLITEFIEGLPLLLNGVTEKNKEYLINLISKYQGIDIDLPKFNYFDHIKKYEVFLLERGRINKKISKKLKDFYPHLKDFQNEDWNPVLCHHDLSPSNIIKTSKGLRIIDWEFSAYGYSKFDKEHLIPSKNKDSFLDNLFEVLEELWFAISKI